MSSFYAPTTIYGTVDPLNSTEQVLNANATFTGTASDISKFAACNINVSTDFNSSLNGLLIQFSSNGTDWDITQAYTISTPNTGTVYSLTIPVNILAKYYRVRYTNGSSSQGVFRLQSILNTQSSATTSIIANTLGANYPKILTCSSSGSLNVKLSESCSMMGDARVIQPTIVSQLDFVYGINSNYTDTFVSNSGTVDSSDGKGIMNVTNDSGSTASITSKKYLKYSNGLGSLARFSTIYSGSSDGNNIRIAGLGDNDNGFFFGYHGGSFGILYRRNGIDTWTSQSNWNVDNAQGSGGSNNNSLMKLSPQNGNVYQITFGNSGFGNVGFYIYNTNTNNFTNVHNIIYSNTHNTTIVTNPYLPLLWSNINTDITTHTPTISAVSGSIFIDGGNGDGNCKGTNRGRSNNKVDVGTNDVNIISLKNNNTINGITNKSSVKLSKLSFWSVADSNVNSVILNMWLNPEVNGVQNFVDINSQNSICSIDVDGGSIVDNTGVLLNSFSSCFGTGGNIDLSDYDIFLAPGDVLVFSVKLSNSNGSTRSGVSVNWCENTS